MRHNPYGQSVVANPSRGRIPAAGEDPRHGALFGAAFAVGLAARAATAGVDHLVVAAPTGPFGVLDDLGRRRPLQAVHSELASAAGAECFEVLVDHPGIAAVAYRAGEHVRIIVANLTPIDVKISVPPGARLVGVIGKNANLAKPNHNQPILGSYRSMVLEWQPS